MNTTIEAAGLLTTAQAARALGVTPAWVRALMKQGKLDFLPTGLGRLIDPSSVETVRIARATATQNGSSTLVRD